MAPVQWLKVKEIVGEALERRPDERTAFLDHICLHDTDLRAEVDSLLAASSQADGFSKHSFGLLETGCGRWYQRLSCNSGAAKLGRNSVSAEIRG